MSDIFISYKREDQGAARKLANALEVKGGLSGGTRSSGQVNTSMT